MPTIDLVHDPGCPNVGLARARLREALEAAGLPPAWTEWDTGEAACPDRVRGYGSPTVLVDGRDVEGRRPVEGTSCRIYPGAAGHERAPTVDLILAALDR